MQLIIQSREGELIDATDIPLTFFLKKYGLPESISVKGSVNVQVLSTDKGLTINNVPLFECEDAIPLFFRSMSTIIGSGENRLEAYNLFWLDRKTLKPLRCYLVNRSGFKKTTVSEFVVDTVRELLQA